MPVVVFITYPELQLQLPLFKVAFSLQAVQVDELPEHVRQVELQAEQSIPDRK